MDLEIFNSADMKYSCPICSGKKSAWDTHLSCILCTKCSKNNTCKICSTWTASTWKKFKPLKQGQVVEPAKKDVSPTYGDMPCLSPQGVMSNSAITSFSDAQEKLSNSAKKLQMLHAEDGQMPVIKLDALPIQSADVDVVHQALQIEPSGIEAV